MLYKKYWITFSVVALLAGAISATPAQAAAKATTTAISTSASQVTINTEVTLAATVAASGGTPTGSVVFSVSASPIGNCTLAAGSCSISYTWTARGTYPVIATYTPTGNFLASASVALSQVVTRYSSTVSVVSSRPNAYIGMPLDFTITASGSGPTPTGTANLYAYESNTVIGTCTLASGACVIHLAASTVGNHRVWASYSGDDVYYLPSDSAYIYQNNMAKLVPTITISHSPTTSNFGDAVTFTATTSGADGIPVGSILFENSEGSLGSCTMVSGTCSISVSSLTVGAHTIAAEFGGDSTYSGAEATLSHTVNEVALATTTMVTSSSNPSIDGRSVTFTVTVTAATGTPTGPVVVKIGPTTVGSCTLTAGSCTYASALLPVGDTTLTAYYAGSTSYLASNGSITQTVNSASARTTSTSMTPSVESVTVGSTVTLNISVVNSEVVTGTVILKDGATQINSCTLSAGACSITFTPATVGTHSLTAIYPGNATFDTSTATLNFVVNLRPGAMTFTSSNNPAARLTLVTFSVTLHSSATGIVIFEDGETQVGNCTLVSGACSAAISFATVSTHVISAEYSGDALNSAITKTISQVIGLTPTTVAVTSDLTLAQYYETINFTAVVSDSTATGTIEFLDGSDGIKSCTLASGQCTIFFYRLTVGSHNMRAVYGGDATHAGSTSPILVQVVTLASTSIALTSSENPFGYGGGLTLTGSVTSSGIGATGSIQFEDYTSSPSVILGSCTISATLCSITLVSPLSVGTHKIKAEYSSDGNYAGSVSSELSQVISAPLSDVAVVSSKSTIKFGETVTLTVNVSASGITATGTVQIKNGAVNLGAPITLVDGSATLITSALPAGTHSLTAVYSGDANHAAATSPIMTQTVQYLTTAAITVVPISSVFLEAVSITSAMSSAYGTPTGLVIIEEEIDGSSDVIVGSCTLSAGSCTFSTNNLSVGTHDLYLEYGGSGLFGSAFSSSVRLTVTPRPVAAVTVVTVPTPSVPEVIVEIGKPIVATINEKEKAELAFKVKDALGRIAKVAVIVPAGAVPTSATLEIIPEASVKPDEKGFVALEIKILSNGVVPIARLEQPILLKISRLGTIAVPALSTDGENWYSVKRVTSTSLAGDELDGFFVGEDRSLNVLTVHLAIIDLLKSQHRLSVQSVYNHIHLGQSVQLASRGGSGKGEVIFSTSTPAVCSVSPSGVMSALSVGSCAVTVAKGHDEEFMNTVSEVKIFAIRPTE